MVRNYARSIKIDVPLLPEEAARFRVFLKETGRKAGPWVRTLVLRGMEEEQARDGLRGLAGREAT